MQKDCLWKAHIHTLYTAYKQLQQVVILYFLCIMLFAKITQTVVILLQ